MQIKLESYSSKLLIHHSLSLLELFLKCKFKIETLFQNSFFGKKILNFEKLRKEIEERSEREKKKII